MLKGRVGPREHFKAGGEYFIPAERAQNLVDKGLAVFLDEAPDPEPEVQPQPEQPATTQHPAAKNRRTATKKR